MSEQEFFGYQDIGEKGFIKWALDYTLEPIISDFLSIPVDDRYRMQLGKLPAPCTIFLHIAENEEALMKAFARGITEFRLPFAPELFNTRNPPSEQQLREGIKDAQELVDYWRAVREDTLEYLDQLTAEELRQRPKTSALPDSDGNRDNPIREFFIMAIQHQNCHWGELRAICKLLGAPTKW